MAKKNNNILVFVCIFSAIVNFFGFRSYDMFENIEKKTTLIDSYDLIDKKISECITSAVEISENGVIINATIDDIIDKLLEIKVICS